MLNITTWNVKGLKSPEKRMKILRHLKRLKADIALLQETHLESNDWFRMKKLWVGQVTGSSALNRKAGTMILIRKGLQAQIEKVDNDTEGRIVTASLSVMGKTMYITSIYAPNSGIKEFYQKVMQWILKYPQSNHLIGGDFNDVMDIMEDRKSKSPGNPKRDNIKKEYRNQTQGINIFLKFYRCLEDKQSYRSRIYLLLPCA